MIKGIFTLLILILSLSLSSISQNESNCEQLLNQLIEKVESEYPGFKEKTKDLIIYSDFKNRLKIKSQNVNNTDCTALLKYYLSYFRDPHLRLYQTSEVEVQGENKEYNSNVKVDISLTEFYKYISETKDELEGVWKSSSYKVGIKKIKNEYQAFIIESNNSNWKCNEIKFRLMDNEKANYYMGDHSLREDNYELIEGSIISFKNNRVVFIKELPIPKLSPNEIQLKLDKIKGFYFTKLSNKTSVLSISSFEDEYVERIEKIILNNQQAIENSENLIVDVRNNLGGTYDAYDELLPYIITNNIRGVGQEFLVTQTLIDGVENWFDDEEGKKQARRWIKLFEGNIGKFVNVDTADVYMNKIKIAKRSPKQIVVLVNKRTASSGEAFVLEAKQSKKVKILGVPTYGAMDYGSGEIFDFGHKNYKLHMPTWRSMRLPDYPIDNIGVQPDIYLDKSIKDWIQFAVEYLENEK